MYIHYCAMWLPKLLVSPPHTVAECQFSTNLIITFDRSKIQTSNWHHFVSLVKTIRMTYNKALKEITHLRHFSKTLSIIFTIQFSFSFQKHLLFSQTKSWVSQNNRKVKKRVWMNRTQRHGASQSHSSCCELIGHCHPTDEVVRAAQRPPSSAGSEFLRCKFKFIRGVSEFSRAE